MKPIHVRVSNCAMIVNGEDRETLLQLWNATKNIKHPYQIVRAPRTGDDEHYIIRDAA